MDSWFLCSQFTTKHLSDKPGQPQPVTSRTPLKPQSPEPAHQEDWERLLTGPTATPNFIPQPEPLPKPYAPNAKPLKELPIPALGCPYPPAPLTQPEDKLALCNHNGVVTAWIGK